MLPESKTARGAQESAQPESKPPASSPDLTKYVAEFVLNLKYEDIPTEIVAQSKTYILDGLGLALAGSMAQSGPISRASAQSGRTRSGE